MAKKTQYYLLFIIGSILYIGIPFLVSPDRSGKVSLFTIAPFKREFLIHVLLLSFFFLNYFYLIPRYYLTRRYWIFFLLVFVCLIVAIALPNLLFMQNMPRPMPALNMQMPGIKGYPWRGHFLVPPMYIGGVLHFMLIFSLSFVLKLNRRLEDIQQEKLKTEVSYLKAQINPHFLFNTLNSLYALTLEKSDAAPEAVLKLSGMMRYVVTESGRDSVPLENELNYLKNYISLQRLRMDAAMQFSFEVNGNTAGQNISPMLLIPFIENAFKYGLSPEEQSEISIAITIENNTMLLVVRNKKVQVTVQPDEESGHGLENTRHRLDYLYPNRYELTLNDGPAYFSVNLKIQL